MNLKPLDSLKALKPGQGQVASVPSKEPDKPPIVGVVVPPAVDTAQRTVHSTWQGTFGGIIVTELLPLIGIHIPLAMQGVVVGVLTGLFAFVRSWLAHRRVAKA